MEKIPGYNFLHSHPQTEKMLGLDEHHVIVDRADWEEVVEQLQTKHRIIPRISKEERSKLNEGRNS